MKATIEPGTVSGSLHVPPSKSVTQRALAAALLHKGKTIIRNAGQSADERAALAVIQQLGAAVAEHENDWVVTSNGVNPLAASIDCGESGLAARLFAPIAALSAQPVHITAAGSLLQRPMAGFALVLPALGVGLPGFTGHLPATVQGPLLATDISFDAAGSSQLLSGLLFAFCAAATVPVTITVSGLSSRPYIDLTLAMLARFGWPVSHTAYTSFVIDPALFTHQDTVETTVEADWSSAAFLLVAGAIAGTVTLHNLDATSAQADRAILDVLRLAGAAITQANGSITVSKAQLRAFEYDATDSPDLFPILAILAACCHGESYITGIHRLLHKESNRADTITEMLQDFDVPFSIEDDSLCITGVRQLQGTIIHSFHDHRIAMAAAVGALRASGPTEILNAEAINKSYPPFFAHLEQCGVKCSYAE